MSRVNVYIDGFNLYYGLRAASGRRRYWLDLVALSASFLLPGQVLGEVHYFTARISSRGPGGLVDADVRRQSTYLDALATLPQLQTHEGQFLAKSKSCQQCGATWITYEEKMSDVNLALQLFGDAMDNRFDTAILVSGDSDLAPPIEQVKLRCPTKRVIVAFPPRRQSVKLAGLAHGSFPIGDDKLRRSQLPASVTTANGVVLQRPISWC